MKQNIVPHDHDVRRLDRAMKYGHSSKLIWFTGLSGSGKSTLANALEAYLHGRDVKSYILDGDNIRSGLNQDLSFSLADREENIRRIAEVSNLFVDAGLVVITAFISPLQKDRSFARQLVGEENFLEVFVDCPIEVCEARDVKGLYAKARQGLIKDFTGISSPFEKPESPDIVVDTANNTLEACLDQLIKKIEPGLSIKR